MSDETLLKEENSASQEDLPFIEWKAFLESVPPNVEYRVGGLAPQYRNGSWMLSTTDITLHCASEMCQGLRAFALTANDSRDMRVDRTETDRFLKYVCRNCRKTFKTFAVAVMRDKGDDDEGDSDGVAKKYGENPPYGPHTPSRLIKLIGPHRELFLKGRRAESQGLGIGAFAYYRRVVEDEKDRLFDAVISAAQKLRANAGLIENLKVAKSETQFSTAVEQIKYALPDSLNINGHNPLTLLHNALSDGLHAQTDDECLEIASSIRLVLAALADRISQALKEEAELNAAVSKLMQKKTEDKPKHKKNRHS
jgi:hypothetical protein